MYAESEYAAPKVHIAAFAGIYWTAYIFST